MKKVKACVLVLVIIAIALVCFGAVHSYNSQSLIYCQGNKYVFHEDYAEELPEDAKFLGKAQYKKYRDSLGDELSCNLDQLSPTSQQMIDDENSGDVFYSKSKDAVLIAVNTNPYASKERRYFVFYGS